MSAAGPAQADPIIAADRLSKRYGKSRGIEELTFEVQPAEVFGFLGPNGAGKTTTIRTMLDLIPPTSGRVSIFGLDSVEEASRIHARLGYLPGELALYERMIAGDYLEVFASFRGGVPRSSIVRLADRLGLELDRRIRELSHGNKQKVGSCKR